MSDEIDRAIERARRSRGDLSESEVREIRIAFLSLTGGIRSLARRYRVHPHVIRDLVYPPGPVGEILPFRRRAEAFHDALHEPALAESRIEHGRGVVAAEFILRHRIEPRYYLPTRIPLVHGRHDDCPPCPDGGAFVVEWRGR